MKVRLNDEQLHYAVEIGKARQKSAEDKRSVSAFPEQWQGQFADNHINAACAELAVAVALGCKKTLGVDVYSVPDLIDTRIEVRWSRNRNLCKITPRDIEKNRIVIGTVGTAPEIELLGWLEAADGPERGRRSDYPPYCWFIHELAWERLEFLSEERKKPPAFF
jgi:hypothetical protein